MRKSVNDLNLKTAQILCSTRQQNSQD